MQTGNVPPVSTGDVSTVIIIYSWQWLPWRLILPHNSRRGIRRKRFGGSCLCVWLKEIQIERNEDGNADIKACSELKLHHIQRDDRWITHPWSTGNIQNNGETVVDSNFTYAMYKGMFVSGFMLKKKPIQIYRNNCCQNQRHSSWKLMGAEKRKKAKSSRMVL